MKATVRDGRLILNEPTDLPEGSELELIPLDGDDLDDDELRRLHAALAESEDDVIAGRVRPASDFLGELRREK